VASLVTGIATPRLGQKRRVIALDGEEWRATSAAVLRGIGLREGDVVDADDLAAVIGQAEPGAARDRALRLLGYRERSSRELAARLTEDGYPEELVEILVARLQECLLVDDRRFAETVTRSALAGKQLGRRRILRTLDDAGVDATTVAEVVDTLAPADDELERAIALARRMNARVDDPRRLAQRLIRRGYAPNVAFAAVRSVRTDLDEHGL
jgi:regulatory protein